MSSTIGVPNRAGPGDRPGAGWSLKPAIAPGPATVLGLACLVLHLIFNNRYGVFRDELYFIVCGLHPALGYVDQPPLAPWVAGASFALFGPALLPLRLLPALAMAGTVALTAEFARLIGGGRFAQWLAGAAVLLAPVFLVDGLLLITDFIQPLTWLACCWCVVRLVQGGDERWWLAFGAIAGISLVSKYLVGFFIVGLGVGILLTPLRRSLARPWIWLGGAIALAFAAPSLWWQASHGWPFIDLGSAATGGKNLPLSPFAFFFQVILYVGPVSAPVWLAGLGQLALRPPRLEYRAFAVAFVVMFVLFDLAHGKPYYLTPMCPVLFAVGAATLERWVPWAPARRLGLGAVVAAGLVTMPFALPVLTAEQFVAYRTALGIETYSQATERETQGLLPQQFADMFGWPEMAAKVAAVAHALPPEERAKAVFFGRNWGEAAAIELFGPAVGAPPAISGHNNYFLWGTGGRDGEVVITLADPPEVLRRNYRSIEQVGRIEAPYAMPYQNSVPIFVLRGPRQPLGAIWPALRHYE